MGDSPLNSAERPVQHSFSKSLVFNGLFMGAAVLLAYVPIGALPDLKARPAAWVSMRHEPVTLASHREPWRLAGAWELHADDPRFTGLSALAITGNRLLSVSDRGAVVLFDRPGSSDAKAWLADLRDGPGPLGEKWSRDAESLSADPAGRGWWVGFEQQHSLYLYDRSFRKEAAHMSFPRAPWSPNRGAEGLVQLNNGLLVLGENGRSGFRVAGSDIVPIRLDAGAEIADAARAPDGNTWLLLRSTGPWGIRQSVAPLERAGNIYRAGPALDLPKGRWDNLEGLAIERRGSRWRFWLLSDDGHRFMARTILIALDLDPSGHKKSPATSAGPSRGPGR